MQRTSKHKRPPNAGKRGRKPGIPNRVTTSTREMFALFVEHNAGKVQELFDRLARKNPKAALEVLSRFAEFVLPRLQRTELDASVSVSNDGPPIVVVDALEASRIYTSVMRGIVDPSRVVFEVPQREPLPELPAAPVAAVAAPLPPTPPPGTSHKHEPIADSKCAWCRKMYWEREQSPPEKPQEDHVSAEIAATPSPPATGTVVALRAVAPHEHRALADSPCPHCRQLWVQS